MTNEELNKLIEQFDENALKQKGIFGILQFGGGGDESFIRANKEGLELFALQLLKSAKETETTLNHPEKTIITIDINEDWIDEKGDIFIHYIEPIADKQKAKPKEDYKGTVADKLVVLGCGLVVITLIVSVLVGLVTIFKWLL